MLQPQPKCGFVPDPGVGCHSVWDLAEALLTAAYNTLVPFLPTDPNCGSIDTLVSVGPPAVFGDVLAVYMQGYGKIGQASAQILAQQPYAAQYVVELWETRYPIGDGKRPEPPENLHAINHLVYLHGETLYRGVIQAVRDGTVGGCPDCWGTNFGPLIPLGPQGATVGWRFTVEGEPGGCG